VTTAVHHVWDLWIPDVGAQGASFARGRMDAHDVVLVHAAPAMLDVAVRTDDGVLVASGLSLQRGAETPMARLRIQGSSIGREDIWPDAGDVGRPVILMGGEIAILRSWWNDAGHQEWRWTIELYNHR